MVQVCAKAQEEQEKAEDGNEETMPDECMIETMCAIYDDLNDDMQGENSEGDDEGQNPDGYSDEVCAHEASGEPDPELPLPPTTGDGEDCELIIEPCGACVASEGDAGTEGDGAGSGDPGGGGNGG